uniref:Uncharacterized protein n=1 Tax=Ananas comosus var. bracteatus TaxID=296719 RepID=A0A6V7NL34_ANACO|nr:unnamed protein product [Ananas comosus var. bracteatus]
MFHYLNQSNCFELDDVDDSKEYWILEGPWTLWELVPMNKMQYSVLCDEKALEDSLCKRVIVTRGESIVKNLNPEAAVLSRDALAKIVYSRLFDWLVNKINCSIGQDPHSKFLIGVLDIYGFESFKTNSFEQFCINLTNEKLQQHFNQHVFKMEQEEYTKEEIDWSYIEFIDNQDILDLIERSSDEVITSKRILEKLILEVINWITGLASRKELHFRQQTKAAVIYSHCRRYLARSEYLRLKKAAIATQCAWRGRVARRELRKLKMAARETGALQAAKNKLEKQVEELTWRLQLEKRMRVDMEEAKTQENEKLQLALREIELQFKEAKDLLMVKEQEAAEFVAERISSIKEIPVIDTTLLDKLTAENVKLKELVTTLETKINETEKEYEETSRLSEERLKKAMEAESKIIELNNSMQRLQDKLANMESENQILRQQALLQLPVKQTSGRLPTPSTPPKHNSANDQHHREDHKEPHSAPPAVNNYANSDPKMRISYIERQHENVNTLINFVVQNSGLTQGKPVAGLTIYKCLLHWKLFEAEKTSVFDRLIQMIGSAIENLESNEHLAYWLSNASALLFLLQKSLKAAGSAGSTPRRKPPPPTSLFGRMTQGFRSSSANLVVDELDIVQHVEAKYPALLFKQQLSAYVEKIYGIIRDNVKKDLTAILSLCIQAPRTAKASMVRGRSFGNSSQGSQWNTIIEHLDNLLMILQENYVPKVLIQKMFSQIFAFINVQLVNSLLLRRECCSFSNGEYVKCGLEELEVWCTQAKQEYAGSSWDELKQIRQAVGFLVIFQKYRISYEDLLSDLCPMLSVQQLYRICTQYWDDKYNTQSVSSSVLASMRTSMTEESNDADSSSFLLDDDLSIPFSIDEISSSIQEKDLSDVDRPKELLENPAFHFLQ